MKKIFCLLFVTGCLYTNLSAQVLHPNISYKKSYSYKGNKFKFAEPMTLMIAGKARKSIPSPIEVNGEKLYRAGQDIDNQPQLKGYKSFTAYIAEKMKPFFEKLPDGRYTMPTCNLVINEQGKLIFYDFREIIGMSGHPVKINGTGSEMDMMQALNDLPAPEKKQAPKENEIPRSLIKELNKAMEEALINAPMFTPATVSGKKVNCLLFPNYDFNDYIVVKDHKVSFEEGLKLPDLPPRPPAGARMR